MVPLYYGRGGQPLRPIRRSTYFGVVMTKALCSSIPVSVASIWGLCSIVSSRVPNHKIHKFSRSLRFPESRSVFYVPASVGLVGELYVPTPASLPTPTSRLVVEETCKPRTDVKTHRFCSAPHHQPVHVRVGSKEFTKAPLALARHRSCIAYVLRVAAQKHG